MGLTFWLCYAQKHTDRAPELRNMLKDHGCKQNVNEAAWYVCQPLLQVAVDPAHTCTTGGIHSRAAIKYGDHSMTEIVQRSASQLQPVINRTPLQAAAVAANSTFGELANEPVDRNSVD
jgi:hypothetical protein